MLHHLEINKESLALVAKFELNKFTGGEGAQVKIEA